MFTSDHVPGSISIGKSLTFIVHDSYSQNLFSIHLSCLFDSEVLDEVLVIGTVSGTGI